jgi:hypothetical protein
MSGRKNLWPNFHTWGRISKVYFSSLFLSSERLDKKNQNILKQKCAQKSCNSKGLISLKSQRGRTFFSSFFRAGLAGKFRQELATLLYERIIMEWSAGKPF